MFTIIFNSSFAIDHIFIREAAQKRYFFLVARHFSKSPPLLVTGLLKKTFFCGFPYQCCCSPLDERMTWTLSSTEEKEAFILILQQEINPLS